MEKRSVLLALVVIASLTLAPARRAVGFNPFKHNQEVDPSPDTLKKRQKTFDMVWRTVADKLFDPTLRGVDWNAARTRYEIKVKEVKTDDEFNHLLNQMLNELHLTHLKVVSPETVQRQVGAPGDTGIDLRLIDGRAVITSVEKGSPAELAGLAPGFIVTGIDGVSLDEFLSREGDRSWSRPYLLEQVTADMFIQMRGPIGTAVRIDYLDREDKGGAVNLLREKRRAEVMDLGISGVPRPYLKYESRQLAGGIGYIKFDDFVLGADRKIRAGIQSFADAPGIIIDLRGNAGGLSGVTAEIAGFLVEKPAPLEMSRTRKGPVRLNVHPQKPLYSGPIVLLIDGISSSGAELFAAGLQEMGRAKVIGEQSPGNCLAGDVLKLPTGSLLLYPDGDVETPMGKVIEGHGVVPDIEIKLTRADLLSGVDPPLQEGIRYIQHLSR